MNPYDRHPTRPYGYCEDCDQPITSRDDVNHHLIQTMNSRDENRSHRVHVQNPTRRERIAHRLETLHEQAMREHADYHDGHLEENAEVRRELALLVDLDVKRGDYSTVDALAAAWDIATVGIRETLRNHYDQENEND